MKNDIQRRVEKLEAAIRQAIEALEETRRKFNSVQVEKIRSSLEKALDS